VCWVRSQISSVRLAPARIATCMGRDHGGDLVVGEDAEADHGAGWTAINHQLLPSPHTSRRRRGIWRFRRHRRRAGNGRRGGGRPWGGVDAPAGNQNAPPRGVGQRVDGVGQNPSTAARNGDVKWMNEKRILPQVQLPYYPCEYVGGNFKISELPRIPRGTHYTTRKSA
jgi:hypothetical protein